MFQQIQVILCRKTKNSVSLIDCSRDEFSVFEEKFRQGTHAQELDPRLLHLSVFQKGSFCQTNQAPLVNAHIEFLRLVPSKYPDRILLMENLHQYLGDPGSPHRDISHLIIPVLARGQLRLVTNTPIEKYQSVIENSAAIERRIQAVYFNT